MYPSLTGFILQIITSAVIRSAKFVFGLVRERSEFQIPNYGSVRVREFFMHIIIMFFACTQSPCPARLRLYHKRYYSPIATGAPAHRLNGRASEPRCHQNYFNNCSIIKSIGLTSCNFLSTLLSQLEIQYVISCLNIHF